MLSENIESSMNSPFFLSQPQIKTADTVSIVKSRLKKRYRTEKRFRLMGLFAIIISMVFLAILFTSIISSGYRAFWQSKIQLEIFFDPADLPYEDLENADYQGLIKKALRAQFPVVKKRKDKKKLYAIISGGANYQVRDFVLKNKNTIIGQTKSLWLPADDDVDMLIKGYFDSALGSHFGRLSKAQAGWVEHFKSKGKVKKMFNLAFFTSGDSREPELSGILGALVGSLYTLLITLLISFPVGVATAVYMEEFAPKNRWIDIIEVNINNLAAVPSIVFGLLGLAVFLNFSQLPRSTPLVGGLVLTLMTLPTIIIASRVAIKSVPPSIRDAALGIGASKMQTIFHHVLPLAMPGMLTGTIIGMARALGETAPLLMIGMVAFIVDIPGKLTDPSTVLPVQVYLWADSPERAFVERTSAAIMVLLAFLIIMNASAVYLRNKFERRW